MAHCSDDVQPALSELFCNLHIQACPAGLGFAFIEGVRLFYESRSHESRQISAMLNVVRDEGGNVARH